MAMFNSYIINSLPETTFHWLAIKKKKNIINSIEKTLKKKNQLKKKNNMAMFSAKSRFSSETCLLGKAFGAQMWNYWTHSDAQLSQTLSLQDTQRQKSTVHSHKNSWFEQYIPNKEQWFEQWFEQYIPNKIVIKWQTIVLTWILYTYSLYINMVTSRQKFPPSIIEYDHFLSSKLCPS